MIYPLIAIALAATDPAVAKAEKVIDAASLLERTKTLASDEFEGRGPGSKGEEVTIAYLQAQMKQIGLEPGNPDGTYLQDVPMVKAVATYSADLETAGKHEPLVANRDLVAFTHHLEPKVAIAKTDMVFVGYGVVAPEYSWDDFKDVDVRGKTIVMLVNDPPVEGAFKGAAMTYYGRWTYKLEMAAKKGAAAALIIHNDAGAGYPWQTVTESWGRENFFAATPDKGRAQIESWISTEAARKLFAASGLDFDAQIKAAASRDFKPVTLKSKLSVSLEQTQKPIVSNNVVGKISGATDRYVIYTAHWDHFGRDEKRAGDQIFNGALDNATGVAGMLEIAKAFKALKTKPNATIIFLSTTAEERSLLGARHYAQNPLYPLERTLADLNIDALNTWGPTKDMQMIGDRNSTLFDTFEGALKAQGRELTRESSPEKGYAYRADNLEFAKVGVPSIWCFKGHLYVGKPADFDAQKAREFFAHDYHQVSDVVKPDWDMTGGAEDMRALFRFGYAVAQDPHWPEWAPDAEFASKRSESAALRK